MAERIDASIVGHSAKNRSSISPRSFASFPSRATSAAGSKLPSSDSTASTSLSASTGFVT